MAGLVISLEVKVGDRIEKGNQIAVIEAMKMRRPIHSPRSGIVQEILVKEGETVEADNVLMALK
jgi:pyruvate carboxylase subunit B